MSHPYMPVPGAPPPKDVVSPPPVGLGPDRMEYMRAYHFIFENPNWMTNVLWGFLCLLSAGVIPIVGQLVFLGYQFEIVEALYLWRGARYPDFDVNRFSEYLMRGLWPFLVQLVVSLVMVPVVFVLMFGGVLLIGAVGGAMGDDAAGITVLVLMPLLLIAVMATTIAFVVFLMPFTLRAGLAQDFGQAMNFAWAKDFVRKVWVEALLSALFLNVTSFVAVMLGMMALCVGMYAAAAIVMMACGHLMYQLYGLYLARGGEPIPLKPKTPFRPMPPASMPMAPPMH
jgi:hypothetical protein